MDGMVFVKLVYALAHLVERRSALNDVSPELILYHDYNTVY